MTRRQALFALLAAVLGVKAQPKTLHRRYRIRMNVTWELVEHFTPRLLGKQVQTLVIENVTPWDGQTYRPLE